MHVELIECLDRRFGLTLGVAKRGEIVFADETLRRQVHARAVKRLGDAPGAAALEGEIGAAIDDTVEVVALDRGEPRVEGRLTASAAMMATGCGRKCALSASRTLFASQSLVRSR
jgi:hypothetical protein